MSDAGVYGALAAAQAEFPAIPKTHTATVQSEKGRYTYNYADLSDIMAAVRPVLSKHKLALMQPVEMLESGRLVLRTSIVHADGSGVHSMMNLPNMDGKPQAFGSALTYARRYALTSLIGIATEEDDDGTAAQDPGPTERQSRQTRQPSRPTVVPGESPQEAVDRANKRAEQREAQDDEWKLDGTPVAELLANLKAKISERPHEEVERLMPFYVKRLGLTDHEIAEARKAWVARRKAETPITAVGDDEHRRRRLSGPREP